MALENPRPGTTVDNADVKAAMKISREAAADELAEQFRAIPTDAGFQRMITLPSHRVRNRLAAGATGVALGALLYTTLRGVGANVIRTLKHDLSPSSNAQVQPTNPNLQATATAEAKKNIPLVVDGITIPDSVKKQVLDSLKDTSSPSALNPNGPIKVSSDTGSNDLEIKGQIVASLVGTNSEGQTETLFFQKVVHGDQRYAIVLKAKGNFYAGTAIFPDAQSESSYTAVNGFQNTAIGPGNSVQISEDLLKATRPTATVVDGGSIVDDLGNTRQVEYVKNGTIRSGDVVVAGSTIGNQEVAPEFNLGSALEKGQDIQPIVDGTGLAVLKEGPDGKLAWVNSNPNAPETPVLTNGFIDITDGPVTQVPPNAIAEIDPNSPVT